MQDFDIAQIRNDQLAFENWRDDEARRDEVEFFKASGNGWPDDDYSDYVDE